VSPPRLPAGEPAPKRAGAEGSLGSAEPRLRLDKWLWAARFYKTRSLAAQAVDAGQVRVAGERVKTAHPVRTGERVSIRKAGCVWEVTVTGLSDRRGGAAEAALLYREDEASVAARGELANQRKAAAEAFPRHSGRPTKRQRRKLEDFLNEP
jgi:ribosome-associated heat shock protein Hsp15